MTPSSSSRPSYDTIVVGAGAAGTPLAARLSDDPHRTVLLLEAGPDHSEAEFPPELKEFWNVQGAVPGHPNNWAFVASLTPSLPHSVPRGKIVGGSTALNAASFVRARREDFDRWVSLGNDEWSYAHVLPVYREIERDLTFGETEVHGGSGPVPVQRCLENLHPLSAAFNEACAQLGFASEADKNGQQPPGYGPIPRNINGEVRVNTAFAFLEPVRNRTNLTIQGDTYVRRVLFDKIKAVGVEVEYKGAIETIRGREVVLAAGAFKSPHILMLSGVGPRNQLERAGIQLVLESPVGLEFVDHPEISINFTVRDCVDWRGRQDGLQTMLNFASVHASFAGGDLEIMPTTTPFVVLLLGHMLGDRRRLLGQLRRARSSLASLNGVSLKRLAQQFAHRNDYALLAALQQPIARGRVTITSSDPHTQPRIDYHYLEQEHDRRRMREVARTGALLLQSPAYHPYLSRLTELSPRILNDDSLLDAWMRSHLSTGIHAAGTCRMGPADDPGAVVDQYGRVRGLQNLRVADTSIMPVSLSRGPAPTAIVIGIRIADFIQDPTP